MQRRTFLVRGYGLAATAAVAAPWVAPTQASTPIVVGQSAALSGPQAGFGTAMRDGVRADM